MGQIFHACVYDIENRACNVIYADKFHANCHTFSGAVAATHYARLETTSLRAMLFFTD